MPNDRPDNLEIKTNRLHDRIDPTSEMVTGIVPQSGGDDTDVYRQVVQLPSIPGYQITGEIARSGMGRVLAGRELALDREVAIKVLLPGSNADRFLTESRCDLEHAIELACQPE